MSRTLYDIAYSGLEDLYELQDAFNNIKLIFTVMKKVLPADSAAHGFATLGVLEVEALADKVSQWSEWMDNELDGFPEENRAHFAKHLRREALRAGGAV